jgi:hypothetical protein
MLDHDNHQIKPHVANHLSPIQWGRRILEPQHISYYLNAYISKQCNYKVLKFVYNIEKYNIFF